MFSKLDNKKIEGGENMNCVKTVAVLEPSLK
jgi:hypothetical protein